MKFREEKMKLKALTQLGMAMVVLFSLGGCTSSATSQLKESPCKECLDKKPFYRNGVWLEESHD